MPFWGDFLGLVKNIFIFLRTKLYSIWQAVYSYLDRLLSGVICGNLVITNHYPVQNVVQTCQFASTIEYNQPTQNKYAISRLEFKKCWVK